MTSRLLQLFVITVRLFILSLELNAKYALLTETSVYKSQLHFEYFLADITEEIKQIETC